MSIQHSSSGSALAGIGVAERVSEQPRQAARSLRRLPVQKDWPFWALIAAQIGILVGVLSLWEIAARAGWIDAFFWS